MTSEEPVLALLVDPDFTPAAAAALAARMPALRIVTDRAQMASTAIRYIVTFAPPPGTFARLRGLRLICSPGAGAEKLLESPDLPDGVPLTRVVDPATNAGVVQYIVHMLLRHVRKFADYEAQQREGVWKRIPVPEASGVTVGVLGLGSLGADVARACVALGFRVAGWSRAPKDMAGVRCHSGDAGLQDCLRDSDVVICLLPLTAQTRGILDARRLAMLPRGAYVINVARGAHVVADDLVAAIDSGHLAGAALDVHVPEPLAPSSPLWTHPRITVTPHIAWRTTPQAMAEQVCTNIARLERGEPLLHEVQRQRGY